MEVRKQKEGKQGYTEEEIGKYRKEDEKDNVSVKVDKEQKREERKGGCREEKEIRKGKVGGNCGRRERKEEVREGDCGKENIKKIMRKRVKSGRERKREKLLSYFLNSII